jgi:hypothetical protein
MIYENITKIPEGEDHYPRARLMNRAFGDVYGGLGRD